MNALVAINQTNGTSLDLEMNAELLDQLGWRSSWAELTDKLQRELSRTRKVRPLLPQFGDEGLDPDAIADFTVSVPAPPQNRSQRPEPLLIEPRPRMVSAEIGREFRLTVEQRSNIQAAKHLITKAAHQVALAEDALLLLGKDLLRCPDPLKYTQRQFLKLSIDHRNLDQQELRLLRPTLTTAARAQIQTALSLPGPHAPPGWFTAQSGDVEGGMLTSQGEAALDDILRGRYLEDKQVGDELYKKGVLEYTAVTNPRSILDSILQGIDDLQERGHYGECCALVAPDLYQAAYQPYDGDISSAPIYQILPRLREGGFGSSSLVPPGMGVIWSLGGGSVGVAVPREAHVTFVRRDNDVILSVQERVRLIVNEPRAVVLLRDPDPSRRITGGTPIHQLTVGFRAVSKTIDDADLPKMKEDLNKLSEAMETLKAVPDKLKELDNLARDTSGKVAELVEDRKKVHGQLEVLQSDVEALKQKVFGPK